MSNYNIKDVLDRAAARINTPAFISDDPVQFPRRFTDQRDIEVVALLVAHISWGRRPMILRDAERLLALMCGEPYRWVEERGYEGVDDARNIHRTFFGGSLKYFCRGLHTIYLQYGSVERLVASAGIADDGYPAWALARAMNRLFTDANQGGHDSYCLPMDYEHTALKRINMALRWLVRDDGIVDMGLWKALRPRQLFVPLDVHVGDTARALGLTARHQNDRRTAVEITERLRLFNPDDPCLYDFALFGLGIEGNG